MKKVYVLFYGSIILGILLWLFFFIITPIEVKNELSSFTTSFIILNYLALVFGFALPLFPISVFKKSEWIKTNKLRLLETLIALILISFLFRYYDLFYNRNLSFWNSIKVNNFNAGSHFSFLFNLLSAFRVIYFVPLIYYYNGKIMKKRLLALCFLLFLLPLIEGYLRGSRRIIFESLGLLFLILISSKKINFRSLKIYVISLPIVIIFIGFSFFVVQSRTDFESPNQFYEKIITSQYNDFVPPNRTALRCFEESGNSLLKKALFTEIHVGQYIVHGVYEMDYMVSKHEKHTYGMFNFYLLIKFFNKLGIIKVDLDNLNNPTGRITYITFFGGLFNDFGWFSLIAMFLLGWAQRQLFRLRKSSYFADPLIVIFLFSNIFLLIFNFIRANLLLAIGVYLLFLIILQIFLKLRSIQSE